MKGFCKLLKKDIKLILNNYFLYVTLFLAIFFILLVNFVIPEDTSIEQSVYVLSEYEEGNQLIEYFKEKEPSLKPLDSREELIENMKNDFNSIGLVFADRQNIEYVLQGHENKKTKNLLVLNIENLFQEFSNQVNVKTTYLVENNTNEEIPFNKLIVPLFLVMEPALIGLFLIATMVFSEKEEGTIKAYAVTPGNMFNFLISKVVLLIILGFISLFMVTVATVGLKANYLHLVAITLTGSIMGSGIGLLLSSFFDNISKSMIWVIIIAIILSLPFASYFVPNFSPTLIKAIPSYPMMFAYKEALFPAGNSSIIYNTCVTTLIIGIFSLILANLNFKRSL